MTTIETPAPQSPERMAPPTRATTGERLAIYGGSPTVTVPYRERWRQIPIRAKLRIVKRMIEDTTTHDGRGYEVLSLENQLAEMSGTKHALLMNSGTAALHSAYVALGVRPGDEVIVPSYTFYASVAPILQCGAKPVFCEIDPVTLTADAEDVLQRITPRTRAICVVHVWGNPARMDRLREIADKHNIGLIEDASHAHGATYKGRPVGSWGDIGCFSLQGQKAVSGGEAGVAVTDNDALFDRMLALGHFPRPGMDQAAETVNIGGFSLGLKYRPHLYAAILAQESLKKLPELNRRRRRNLQLLCEALEGCPALKPVESFEDAERGGFLSFLFHYNAESAAGWNAGAFCHAVNAEGAPLSVDRYEPLHRNSPFSGCDFPDFGGALGFIERAEPASLPVTEATCKCLIAFPAFSNVSEKFLRQCAEAIHKVTRAVNHIKDLRSGN